MNLKNQLLHAKINRLHQRLKHKLGEHDQREHGNWSKGPGMYGGEIYQPVGRRGEFLANRGAGAFANVAQEQVLFNITQRLPPKAKTGVPSELAPMPIDASEFEPGGFVFKSLIKYAIIQDVDNFQKNIANEWIAQNENAWNEYNDILSQIFNIPKRHYQNQGKILNDSLTELSDAMLQIEEQMTPELLFSMVFGDAEKILATSDGIIREDLLYVKNRLLDILIPQYFQYHEEYIKDLKEYKKLQEKQQLLPDKIRQINNNLKLSSLSLSSIDVLDRHFVRINRYEMMNENAEELMNEMGEIDFTDPSIVAKAQDIKDKKSLALLENAMKQQFPDMQESQIKKLAKEELQNIKLLVEKNNERLEIKKKIDDFLYGDKHVYMRGVQRQLTTISDNFSGFENSWFNMKIYDDAAKPVKYNADKMIHDSSFNANAQTAVYKDVNTLLEKIRKNITILKENNLDDMASLFESTFSKISELVSYGEGLHPLLSHIDLNMGSLQRYQSIKFLQETLKKSAQNNYEQFQMLLPLFNEELNLNTPEYQEIKTLIEKANNITFTGLPDNIEERYSKEEQQQILSNTFSLNTSSNIQKILGTIYDAQSFNGLPKIVNWDTIFHPDSPVQKDSQGNDLVFFRSNFGVSDDDPTGQDRGLEYVEYMRSGETHWPGKGVSGYGTYMKTTNLYGDNRGERRQGTLLDPNIPKDAAEIKIIQDRQLQELSTILDQMQSLIPQLNKKSGVWTDDFKQTQTQFDNFVQQLRNAQRNMSKGMSKAKAFDSFSELLQDFLTTNKSMMRRKLSDLAEDDITFAFIDLSNKLSNLQLYSDEYYQQYTPLESDVSTLLATRANYGEYSTAYTLNADARMPLGFVNGINHGNVYHMPITSLDAYIEEEFTRRFPMFGKSQRIDIGIKMAILGYDAYYAHLNSHSTNAVILNRAILNVADTTITPKNSDDYIREFISEFRPY